MVDSNGTVDTARRDLYLGVYGALGVGQCKSQFTVYLENYIIPGLNEFTDCFSATL